MQRNEEAVCATVKFALTFVLMDQDCHGWWFNLLDRKRWFKILGQKGVGMESKYNSIR